LFIIKGFLGKKHPILLHTGIIIDPMAPSGVSVIAKTVGFIKAEEAYGGLKKKERGKRFETQGPRGSSSQHKAFSNLYLDPFSLPRFSNTRPPP
jgi:hypothetical protein